MSNTKTGFLNHLRMAPLAVAYHVNKLSNVEQPFLFTEMCELMLGYIDMMKHPYKKNQKFTPSWKYGKTCINLLLKCYPW